MSPIAPIPFTVTLGDGTTEKLLIKALPISQIYLWLYAAVDRGEPAMVAICTGKDTAWIDNLDIDSFGALAQKCNELNFPLAIRLAKKGAPVAAALVAPLLQRNLLGLRVTMALSTPSGDLSSTLPPSVSAAETPNASQTSTPSQPSPASSSAGNG